MTRAPMKRTIAGLGLALSLGGCISLLPQAPAPPRIFTIVPEAATPATVTSPVVVSLARPNVPNSLAGRDIPWRKGAEVAFIDSAAWDSVAAELLHTLVLDTLSQQRFAASVVRVADGSRADYEIRWDVLRFEVEEPPRGPLMAHFEVTARILSAQSRRVLSDQRFVQRAPMANRSATAATAALGQAGRALSSELGVWAAGVIAADQSQPNAASSSR